MRSGDYIVSLFRNNCQERGQELVRKKVVLEIINNNEKLLKVKSKPLKKTKELIFSKDTGVQETILLNHKHFGRYFIKNMPYF